MPQQLIFTNNVGQSLNQLLAGDRRVAVIVDENTAKHVLPQLQKECSHIANSHVITIGAGDVHKNLNTVVQVWNALEEMGATRHSTVVNLGGGVVTDLGGFAAATFKRGIRFINVPTTLLSAVDAAVGGKTGINFAGFKNEIGSFKEASEVIISTKFFATLPQEEVKSGFAEMLKHGMLKGEQEFTQLLQFNFSDNVAGETLLDLLRTSVQIKKDIVAQDPLEQGVRRALNLGHTVGHAFESMALQRGKPIAHGYAVAWGLVAETVLSHRAMGFDSGNLHRLASFVKENYGAFFITCDDYPSLLHFMQHDKKSLAGEINCTLLAACGDIRIDQTISNADMEIALDLYRDLMGI